MVFPRCYPCSLSMTMSHLFTVSENLAPQGENYNLIVYVDVYNVHA